MKIFLSYTSADRDWAMWIGVTLRDAGHELFVHEWEVGAGQNIPAWMERRIGEADRMIGVFSPAYVQAIHSNSERWAAYWLDPGGRDGFLVPVEVEPLARWPAFAANLRRLSLVGKSEAEAEAALVAFLEPPRAPTGRPPFPGSGTGGGARAPTAGPIGAGTRSVASSTSEVPKVEFSSGSAGLPPAAPTFPPAGNAIHTPPLAPKIGNETDLRRWLEGRSREVAVAIAVRAALRVAPLLDGIRVSEQRNRSATDILLPLLRGMAAPWAAAKYPAHGADLAARAAAAAYAAAADNADDAAYAAARAAALWSAVSSDAAALDAGLPPADLAARPLWPNEIPSALRDRWDRFARDLLSRGEDWDVWTSWYEDRLHGRPADEEKEIARLTLPEVIWQQGAEFANAEIKRRFAEIDARREVPPLPSLAPGAAFRFGDSGLAFVVSDAPEAGFDRGLQSILYEELQLATRTLVEISADKDNEHAALCRVVTRYAQAVAGPLDRLDPRHVQIIGTGLTAYADAFARDDLEATMEGPLEPSHHAALTHVAELHRAFVFGFAETRSVIEPPDGRIRSDPTILAAISRPLGILATALAEARDWVTTETREIFAAIDTAVRTAGRRTWEVAFVAYGAIRNALIETSRAVADLHGLMSTAVGAVVLTNLDPNFAVTTALGHAAMAFMLAHSAEIASFAASFPEMRAWFDWILARLESMR